MRGQECGYEVCNRLLRVQYCGHDDGNSLLDISSLVIMVVTVY